MLLRKGQGLFLALFGLAAFFANLPLDSFDVSEEEVENRAADKEYCEKFHEWFLPLVDSVKIAEISAKFMKNLG